MIAVKIDKITAIVVVVGNDLWMVIAMFIEMVIVFFSCGVRSF